jgi:hypothetical protein
MSRALIGKLVSRYADARERVSHPALTYSMPPKQS